ncbi:hypothetical protein UCRPC4_g01759 [Phaeomoniella chlamydospora]|uniref:Uncharacterized protein n=1 Tax=Phaeomoniella chlamydospora TaxID=158046 RepID=A0A0G2HAA8_PHACM|nr:hypothetical protein UCRPC4_g01759 [Phaeomoniella chlamydospora]
MIDNNFRRVLLRGGKSIYYSWFVIAALGLNISQYALEGGEASMLNQRKWATKGKIQIADHEEHSWARPDGWFNMIKRVIFHRKNQPSARPTKLWILLAVITLFGFFGLPLSGLTMNFGTGYYASKGNPLLVGFTKSNWNSRFKSSVSQRVFFEWNTDATISIPGSGVIYSAPQADRSKLDYLVSLPNTLPDDARVSNLFLTPQADVPINGSSWGLAFGFECSVVNKLSDFTILNHREASTNFSSSMDSQYTVLGGNAIIQVYNQTDSTVRVTFANDIQAVAEIGYDDAGQTQQEVASPPAASECYNPTPLPQDKTMPYPGLDQPQALEFVLWQNLSAHDLYVENPPTVNLTLPDTIPTLHGAYSTSVEDGIGTSTPMAAIGVRCTSVSAVGTADINGRHSTFSNFQRSDDTPSGASGLQCAERLSLGVPHLLFSNALSSSDPTEWLSYFYNSVGKFQQGYSQADYEFTGNQINLVSSYLQATELQRSLTRAYSLYALELVYNNGVGYVDQDGNYVHNSSFTNNNATAYTRNTILLPGIVPPVVVAILLALWALGSLGLSLLYGFRRH